MKNKERVLWVALTAFLIAFSAFAFTTPKLSALQSGNEVNDYLGSFEYLFQFLLQNYVDEGPPKQLYEGALKGMFESLDDPYSYYLTASDMEKMNDTTIGEFGGVGLYISKPAKSDTADDPYARFVRVVSPIEDTPAYRAGVHAGDYITRIESEPVDDLTIDEVVDKLRGKPGTDVTVTLLRSGDIEFEKTLTRAIIEIPTVKEAMIPGGIGYLRIIQFTPYTDDRVKEAIRFFEKNNYTSLIIDVRGNPGGLLDTVAKTADFFLDKGVIVSTKSRIKSENEVFYAKRSILVPKNIPIAVLIDKGSASAAEILSGALKDTGRGVLVGETSFGKGSVQKILPFHDGGVKLTIAKYYTPSGVNIDKIGIDPNYEVKEEELSDEETAALGRILKEQLITNFIDTHPDPTMKQREDFINKLHQDGIALEDRLLERLIQNEINLMMDKPPVYDLDYDLALQEAVRLIKTGKIKGQ
ncbi:MAG: S41 family peptidase [Spirochaetes bacterium]|nr:MAG: S41 family peptidase [Spirochaetota bacterium]